MVEVKRHLRRVHKFLQRGLGLQQLTDWKGRPKPLAVFVSFPKSGRTWLRVMLDYLETPLEYDHANSQHQKGVSYEELEVNPAEYATRKVVLIVRDPRDVVVSGYFQATRRLGKPYTGDISEFIRDPGHGIEKVIHFNNLWLAAAQTMPNILVVRYEDCHADPAQQLKRVLQFLGRHDLSDHAINRAVEFGRFDNMRQKEVRGEFEAKYGAALKPVASPDSESYKTRRGKVGGFVDYLSSRDIAYCQDVMRRLKSEYLQDRQCAT